MQWSGARSVRQIWWCVSIAMALVLAGFALFSAPTNTAVVDAAREGDMSGVQKALKDRGEVNARANDGSSALLWAAYHGDLDMTKALLAAGASVDAENRYGVTPLLQASRDGEVEIIQALLDAGADATRWHGDGETPLMAAARTGKVDAVELLLKHGAFVNGTDPIQEQTALMWAASEGHADAIRSLLKAGANPNLQAHVSALTQRKNADHPSGGFTALMFAARNGHRAAVEALMKGGADSGLTNADGLTATAIAVINDRFDLAKDMVDLGANPNDALYFAVDMRDATADMRAQDATRMQPDHENKLTALALVKALLDVGADPNKPFTGAIHSTSMCCGPSINSSPFYRAAVAADVEVLKLLIAKGAKMDWSPAEIKAEAGKRVAPALNAAVGQPAAAAAMKGGKGAAIQGGPGYTRSGPPPFREPGSRDTTEALKLLLAAGADPNAKSTDGSTLLHQAVQANSVDKIRALAEAGAKFDVVNRDNLTPLLLAEKNAKAPAPPPAVPQTAADFEKAAAAAKAKAPPPNPRLQTVAVVRELMKLGPDDPAPQPPPPPPAAPGNGKDKGKAKGKQEAKQEAKQAEADADAAQ